MSADKIVAQPTTLTGSIGIFSVITTFEKASANLVSTPTALAPHRFLATALRLACLKARLKRSN